MSPNNLFTIDKAKMATYTWEVKNVRFADKALEALEKGEGQVISEAVTAVFRKRMQLIRAAHDERDFYAMKSLHFEKLKGNRSHQHSMRINDQFRLIVEYEGMGTDKTIVIVGVEDYH